MPSRRKNPCDIQVSDNAQLVLIICESDAPTMGRVRTIRIHVLINKTVRESCGARTVFGYKCTPERNTNRKAFKPRGHSPLIEVSGDILEGGGQIVRTTIALAALTSKPVRITKIRDKRPNPGLQAQHVIGVQAVSAISNAETRNLVLGSRELDFMPRGRANGHFRFDVGTAGSIPLILQALLPAAAYAPGPLISRLRVGRM
jgi:hypothetical protein